MFGLESATSGSEYVLTDMTATGLIAVCIYEYRHQGKSLGLSVLLNMKMMRGSLHVTVSIEKLHHSG